MFNYFELMRERQLEKLQEQRVMETNEPTELLLQISGDTIVITIQKGKFHTLENTQEFSTNDSTMEQIVRLVLSYGVSAIKMTGDPEMTEIFEEALKLYLGDEDYA